MVAWPISLPAPLLDSQAFSDPDNSLRSSMDKGPDKVRRRTVANVAPISFSMFLTKAQAIAMRTFYRTTTFSGSVPFDFEDPLDASIISARFLEPPQYTEVQGVGYNVAISLEILP